MKIAFFGVTDPIQQQSYRDGLSGQELSFIEPGPTEAELPDDHDFEILCVFVKSQITAKVIDAFPNLKFIAIRSTGFDNVDYKYANQQGIGVSNVPAYGSHTVAEYTFALLLTLSRKMPQAIDRLKTAGEFNTHGLKGFDLFGKTLGVLGTGKIGSNVIKIAKGFGMQVVAFDLFPNPQLALDLGFEYAELPQVLAQSDIITIHLPSTDQTRHLLNKETIPTIKKGAVLINTARGNIIATDALYQAVESGHLAAVGLDVIENEQELGHVDLKNDELEPSLVKNLLEDNLLLKHPNVIITPHTAYFTQEAEASIIQTTLDNINGFIAGQPINLITQ